MKERLLQYICCPKCKSAFALENAEARDGEIFSGELRCSGCSKTYRITNFVPRILDAAEDEPVQRTAENFGNQWTTFKEMHDTYREQFLDWLHPLTETDFKDKVVLDAGCGMGRLLAQAASFGAREVIGIDLSHATDTARVIVKDFPNAHVIQCNIMELPFDRPFDMFYCIGVVHHMPDPEGGFRSLTRALKPGGIAQTWVYGYENNEWLVNYVNPVREKITSRLPIWMLYPISFLIAIGLHPAAKLFYGPAGKFNIGFAKKILPYYSYIYWLSGRNFRHNHHVIYDHLTAPIAYYIKRDDFAGWFERAGLKNVRITPRNDNSWRGVGVAEKI